MTKRTADTDINPPAKYKTISDEKEKLNLNLYNIIKNILEKHNFEYTSKYQYLDQYQIYNLFVNNIIPNNDYNNSDIFVLLGKYYRIKKDYDNMKKYYIMAIEKNDSMNNFHEQRDYDNMNKYYLIWQ